MTQVKHPQHIICVAAHNVEHRQHGLVDYTLKAEDIIIGQREMLESNYNYRQYLSLAVFTHKGKVWAYKRLQGIGEENLVDRIACASGGHFDMDDLITNDSVIDVEQSIITALARELEEEVSLKGNIISTSELQMKICADDEPVDRKHMAGITVFEVDFPEIDTLEDELESIGFHDPAFLLESPDHDLETWARIICELLAQQNAK